MFYQNNTKVLYLFTARERAALNLMPPVLLCLSMMSEVGVCGDDAVHRIHRGV